MAHEVVTTDPAVFLGEFALTSDVNAHTVKRMNNLKPDTCYGDSMTQRVSGLEDADFSYSGFMSLTGATDTDTAIDTYHAYQDAQIIMCASGVAVGDACEFALATSAELVQTAKAGDVAAFSVSGNVSNRRWVRGRVLWTPSSAITGTADGAEVELGAVAAGQKLYVAMSVTVATVTSVTVKVQSDVTGFGSPTDQVTFTAFTDVTAEFPTPVDGAITDDFFRASISAFSGTSANAIVVAGVA